MQLEQERHAHLEEKVDRLQNTLRAVAREPEPVTLHGPCQSCGECLLLMKGNTMYCPYCGGGQNL